MPLERLRDKMAGVTKDPDRFAARYLNNFYRQERACGMILEDGIDKAVCLEQWLCTMLAAHNRRDNCYKVDEVDYSVKSDIDASSQQHHNRCH